jgi:hypothetical protein
MHEVDKQERRAGWSYAKMSCVHRSSLPVTSTHHDTCSRRITKGKVTDCQGIMKKHTCSVSNPFLSLLLQSKECCFTAEDFRSQKKLQRSVFLS